MISTKKARLYKTKVIHIKHNFNAFLELKAKEIANKHIIDPIIQKMQDLGFSDKIWQNTYLYKDIEITPLEIKFRVISDYESETGYDVAVGREYGTKDHMVAPRVKKSLHWIQGGKSRFSKGHKVSGVERHLVITETIREQLPVFQMKLREETAKYIKKMLEV